MGVGGLCPKRASAQIRCKCTKKNGADDVSTSFFETLLCTPSLHARFFPHYPRKSPVFSSKTRNRRTQLPNLRRPLRRRRVPPFAPRRFRTRRTYDGEDTLARNAHNAHLSRFSIFAFTPSHTLHKYFIHRLLSVKTFISDTFTRLHLLFAPSSAHAATPHRAPRAIVPARDGGEGFASKTFTPIYMNHNILQHTGEGVKAKIENRLMRAREKPSKK